MGASVGNRLLEQQIVTESGDNKLEVLVFRLGDYTFGIHTAKVREVLPRGPLTPAAPAHPSLLGILRLREAVVPVVSLRRHLQMIEGEASSDQTLIVAECRNQTAAFAVDRVERVYPLSGDQIVATPAISALAHSPVAAVARLEERTLILLDFEAIADQATEQLAASGSLRSWLQPPKPATAAALRAEQAPAWEVEEDDESPANGNPRVWQTYRAELADRSRHLTRLLEQVGRDPSDSEATNEVFRTLHTIRAASMVVPVNEVTRLTQWLESQLASARQSRAAWPAACLQAYADWLRELASPTSAPATVLARGRQLYERLAAGGR